MDFLNNGAFDYYIRKSISRDIDRRGQVLNYTLFLETLYKVFEWVCRSLVLLVTILQIMIRQSTTGLYCIY